MSSKQQYKDYVKSLKHQIKEHENTIHHLKGELRHYIHNESIDEYNTDIDKFNTRIDTNKYIFKLSILFIIIFIFICLRTITLISGHVIMKEYIFLASITCTLIGIIIIIIKIIKSK